MASADRRRLRIVSVALAAAAAALTAGAASHGDVPKELLVPSGSGLTAPTGLVQTPDGGVWIADGIEGVCRVKTDDPKGLVPSDYCGVIHLGPIKASGLAFDPATSNFYAGDANSNDNGVYRLHYDAATGTIDSALKIATVGDRVTALTLADSDGVGGPEVYVAVKRTTTIFKVDDPAGTASVATAGFAGIKSVPSLAALGTTLYVGEPGGVTQIDLTPSTPQPAAPVPGLTAPFPGGATGGLAVDGARNRLYAGTFNPTGGDQIDVLDLSTARAETYALGFAGIGAMTIDSTGTLFVTDDPAVASGAVDSAGQGRLWRLALTSLDTPVTTITQSPPTFINQDAATFAFESRAGVSFMCRTDSEPAATPCTSPVDLTGLAEGLHTFDVYAVDPDPAIGAGEIARRSFVVDMTAPVVRMDNPSSDRRITRDWIDLRFSGNETPLAFECELDGGGLAPCDSPHRAAGLALGDHNFHVVAQDLAGNASDPADPQSSFAFTVEPSPPPPPSPEPDRGPGSSGPGPGAGRTEVPAPATPSTSRRRVLRPRVATLSRRRVRVSQLARRPLGIAFDAPSEARYARIALQPYGRGAPLTLARLITRIDGGERIYIRWRLTRRQARSLARRTGRFRVTVAVGESRTDFGPHKTLIMRVLRRG